MTPFEFKTIVDVKQQQQKADAEKELLTAYMMAYFQRVEKLEPFETYRSKLDGNVEIKKEVMTNEEMLRKVLELNKKLGGSSE